MLFIHQMRMEWVSHQITTFLKTKCHGLAERSERPHEKFLSGKLRPMNKYCFRSRSCSQKINCMRESPVDLVRTTYPIMGEFRCIVGEREILSQPRNSYVVLVTNPLPPLRSNLFQITLILCQLDP